MNLTKIIQSLLTNDLRRPKYRTSNNPLTGHCYVASEAAKHFLGKDWKPQFIRHEGEPHWFLRNVETNEILDVTADQFSTDVLYSAAKGKGFLTKKPSKRARVLIKRVIGKSVCMTTKKNTG